MLEENTRAEKESPIDLSRFWSDEMLRWIHDKLYDSIKSLIAMGIALFGETKLTKEAKDRIETWGNIQPETLTELIFTINSWVNQMRDIADELRGRIGK